MIHVLRIPLIRDFALLIIVPFPTIVQALMHRVTLQVEFYITCIDW